MRRTLQGVLHGTWRRLLNNWQLKLGAFLLAVVFWFFVGTDDTFVSQRALRAPLKVEGLREGQLATGVPETVEVRLSGPGNRIGSLRPDSIDAVLDLRGASGTFEQTVRVFPPQGISLLSVSPSEVLGTVETRLSKEVRVVPVMLGAGPEDALLEARVTPAKVSVTGSEARVARVVRALAPLTSADASTARAYAVDAAGLPVEGVMLEPNEVSLTFIRTPVLHTRRVPVTLTLPELRPLSVASAELSQREVLLAGPKAALAALESVPATAELTTLPERPGRYTVGVALELPEGVSALRTPQLELRLVAPQGVRP